MHAEVERILGGGVVGRGDDDKANDGVLVVPVAVLEAERQMQGRCPVRIVVADDEDLDTSSLVAPRKTR